MTARVYHDRESGEYITVRSGKRRKPENVTVEDLPDTAEESIRGALGDDYVEHIDNDR